MVKVVVKEKYNVQHTSKWATAKMGGVVLPCVLLLCGVVSWLLYRGQWSTGSLGAPSFALSLQGGRCMPNTLVMYIFYPKADDPEYTNNFKFFVREGIKANDGCEYIVVVQVDEGVQLPQLPELPGNARFLEHPNSCFDIGTIGWVLNNNVNVRSYKYFIWINSGVRGPFLPAWAQENGIHWSAPFLAKLNSRVKMVGPTINCGGAFDSPAIPHVQTYMVAVDATGLDVLLRAGVFSCWSSWKDAIVNAELGAARAIFEAGYSIDSMLLRYQGVDWRDPAMKQCNAQMQPIQNMLYDGMNVHPLEVMFVKVKAGMLHADWSHAQQAVKYDSWLLQQSLDPSARAELLRDNEFQRQAPKILDRYKKRGIECFDPDFYIQSNLNDLKVLLQSENVAAATWEHFVHYGFLEGRTYRFSC